MLWPPPPPPPPMARAMPEDGDLVLLEERLAERRPLSAKPRMCPTGEAGETSESGRRMLMQVPTRTPACLRMRDCVEGELSTNYSQKNYRGGCAPTLVSQSGTVKPLNTFST